ncbi:MAG: FAD-dependent monooxygenase [Pseudanabaenaceae cyanobacterium]
MTQSIPQKIPHETPKKIIIIGGGIGGLTCAKACLNAGFTVAVYEKRPLELMLSGPGGIFIQRNGMKVYDRLKLQNPLYEQGGKILKGGFFNTQGHPLYINDPQFIKAKDLGVCLSRGALQHLLYGALPAGIVQTETEFANFDIEPDSTIKVTFWNGYSDHCDVLIGADGLYSQVREQLQANSRPASDHKRPHDAPIYSGIRCWRGITPSANLALNPAYSWGEYWGLGTRFGYFDVGQGMIGFYGFMNAPLDQPKVPVTELKPFLLNLFQDYDPIILQIIQSLDPHAIYEDRIFDRPPVALPWGEAGVTLIGDAAHPVQPNLGQGGCMAIEDAYELSRYLLQSSYTKPADALRQFEQSRSERVNKVFTASRQLGQLGQLDTKWGCWLRDKVYQFTPVWLGDLQFKWLFDYEPTE